MFLAMGELAAFQSDDHSQLNGFAVISMLSTWPIALISVGLAWVDVPPLDAPLSRLAWTYCRRRKHLIALRECARQRGLDVQEPSGKGAALTADEQFDAQHRVMVASSMRQAVSGAATYKVNVRMSSPGTFWRIASGMTRGRSGSTVQSLPGSHLGSRASRSTSFWRPSMVSSFRKRSSTRWQPSWRRGARSWGHVTSLPPLPGVYSTLTSPQKA
jgi:hypothetical protein